MTTATVSSPSATAEQDAARAALLECLKSYGAHASGSLEAPPRNLTFCSCCGSQFLREDGVVLLDSQMKSGIYTEKDVEDWFQKNYGIEYAKTMDGILDLKRFKMRYARKNAPGVTIAFMSKEKAIELLYDGENHDLADGYEIHDAQFPHPISVIWVNK